MTGIYKWSVLTALSVLVGCSSVGSGGHYGASELQPKNINNACSILQEKPHWVVPLVRTAKEYNTSVSTILAIVYQESSFNATARPKLSSKTNRPISSAYGYAQALDGTWAHYKKQTRKAHHRRDVFSHAVDFIGWYTTISYKKNRVSPRRADLLYLNYHEGWGGYARRTHLKKPWLMKTAKKVEQRKRRFDKQLKSCRTSALRGDLNSQIGVHVQVSNRTGNGFRYSRGWF